MWQCHVIKLVPQVLQWYFPYLVLPQDLIEDISVYGHEAGDLWPLRFVDHAFQDLVIPGCTFHRQERRNCRHQPKDNDCKTKYNTTCTSSKVRCMNSHLLREYQTTLCFLLNNYLRDKPSANSRLLQIIQLTKFITFCFVLCDIILSNRTDVTLENTY